jgi:hypothetical protein
MVLRGELRATPRGDAAGYPPHSDLVQVINMLAAMNGFTAQQAMQKPATVRPISARWPCCTVINLPRQSCEAGAHKPEFIFGFKSKGYVLVRARTARPGWACASSGRRRPLPVMLHRWIAAVPSHLMGTHACDETRCIAASHVQPATTWDNNTDMLKRMRRRERARKAAIADAADAQ